VPELGQINTQILGVLDTRRPPDFLEQLAMGSHFFIILDYPAQLGDLAADRVHLLFHVFHCLRQAGSGRYKEQEDNQDCSKSVPVHLHSPH
jgi:hypothetical protein